MNIIFYLNIFILFLKNRYIYVMNRKCSFNNIMYYDCNIIFMFSKHTSL